ncbi:MAG: alanine--tRNA ligase [Anaerolineae bacterium]|nr:alanine--tRNA ligase [Anaerolineae bacterium]
MSKLTGAQIRQSFVDFFVERGHTHVPSASLVPGGDQTLLFTNAGMVQFKEVFLGTDTRPYTRAVDSQKCMRVAGKHNDLDDVGRDNSHHTFFEMLGNWSFGDYYKKEAIEWAWELLTGVWGLEKSRLWFTCFKDEKGEIPADDEAANYWRQQPGADPQHVLFFGRKDNFWEMAETGPCGPCSEIHIDLGEEFCDRKEEPGHQCAVNGNCKRFLELWNLVFIQYNRLSPTQLERLPACHVDTGMGLERIVAVLQGTYSNYKTDLLLPLMDTVLGLTGQTEEEREANLTPYRVIADHGRAATFLIADGVVPGNVGRNYVCRMIIRRAAQFGRKIGLYEPFLAKVADTVIQEYGDFYPELRRNAETIRDNLTREEERFRRTVDAGMEHLYELIAETKGEGKRILDGKKTFGLYATHGLPLEISRDVALEEGLEVDQGGFHQAMEEHRFASGAGKEFGPLGGEDVNVYRSIFEQLVSQGKLGAQGVVYDPYHQLNAQGEVLSLVRDGEAVDVVEVGNTVEVVLPSTGFYVESGGQVSDTGSICSIQSPQWEIKVESVYRPAAGVIAHVGQVVAGQPHVGDMCVAAVDIHRRRNIMRNHTATHLLHAELQKVLGKHARQAGSLVAPDRLRFDFTHPEALTDAQLEQIEAGVNQAILQNYSLKIAHKPLNEAISEGAMALFGEKYADVVRTITIGDEDILSYELCGGTHVSETGDIGVFIIVSEGSAAAGIRRIEAITGEGAYGFIQKRFRVLKECAALLSCSQDEVADKARVLQHEIEQARKQISRLRQELVAAEFHRHLQSVSEVHGIPVLSLVLPNANADTLRQMTDRFRQKYPSGVVVLGTVEEDGRPVIIAAVTEDLVKRGVHAGELVKTIAVLMEGSGGGRPTLAQAGGKAPARLQDAIDQVVPHLKRVLTSGNG